MIVEDLVCHEVSGAETYRKQIKLSFTPHCDDINSEIDGINDFFVKKFNVLMGYEKNNFILSDENILYFHLSHKTDEDFTYIPLADSSEFIWKYLTTSNLIKKIFIGCSVWEYNQFNREMRENSWLTIKASADLIFQKQCPSPLPPTSIQKTLF